MKRHFKTLFAMLMCLSLTLTSMPALAVSQEEIDTLESQRDELAVRKQLLEIALETGFCSQSHFNKAFRAIIGTTPLQYRKQLLQQGVDKYDG